MLSQADRRRLARKPWCTVSHIKVTSLRSKWAAGANPAWHISTRFRNVWHEGRAPARSAPARPMIESGAAPPMVDALRRVRRCKSRRVFLPFLPCALASGDGIGPFHYCASCERAAPDAPETIDDQRRCTGGRDRTIYGGSRGSHPYRAGEVAPSTVHTNDSTITKPLRPPSRFRGYVGMMHFKNSIKSS